MLCVILTSHARRRLTDQPGIRIEIPGFGLRHITAAVCDYTGTLSFAGGMHPEVKSKLQQIAQRLDLHIVTADSRGTAARELAGIATPHFLTAERQDVEKEQYVRRFPLANLAALGNGNNDRLLLRAVKEGGGLAIAVDNGEGCALDALCNAHVLVAGAANALDLLLDPLRLLATLRF